MTLDMIEKKWGRHDSLAVTNNDAAPWSPLLGVLACLLMSDFAKVVETRKESLNYPALSKNYLLSEKKRPRFH